MFFLTSTNLDFASSLRRWQHCSTHSLRWDVFETSFYKTKQIHTHKQEQTSECFNLRERKALSLTKHLNVFSFILGIEKFVNTHTHTLHSKLRKSNYFNSLTQTRDLEQVTVETEEAHSIYVYICARKNKNKTKNRVNTSKMQVQFKTRKQKREIQSKPNVCKNWPIANKQKSVILSAPHHHYIHNSPKENK